MKSMKKVKFQTTVDSSYSFTSLFNEHIKKFDFQHQQELCFLADIETFIKRKCQIEQTYSKSIIDLCEEYTYKQYQKYERDKHRSIPDKWRIFLEEMVTAIDKRLASIGSLLLFCDYFDHIRDQKDKSHKKALDQLKNVQNKIKKAQDNSMEAKRKYCFEDMLNEAIDEDKIVDKDKGFKKDLKRKSINVESFSKIYDHLKVVYIKQNNKVADVKDKLLILLKDRKGLKCQRFKQTDIAKINYIMANNVLNQLVQHYVSSEIPELLQLQNGNMDVFVNECMKSLAYQEMEISRFILSLNSEHFTTTNNNNNHNNSNTKPDIPNNKVDERLLLDELIEFDDLIQFELESSDLNKKKFDKQVDYENAKFFSFDHKRWSAKLDECRSLINDLASNLNNETQPPAPKPSSPAQPPPKSEDSQDTQSNDDGWIESYSSGSLRQLPEATVPTFIIDSNIEAQNYFVLEKKFEMIELNAKIESLDIYGITKEIEKNNDVRYTYEEIIRLRNRLEDLPMIECRYYVEALINTVDKPFIPADDYDLVNDSWQ